MAIIRTCHDKENPYVSINKKTLESTEISWGAKGLWTYLLSRPDNWNVSVAHLVKTFQTDKKGNGEKGIRALLKELIDAGYCRRIQVKGEDGTFAAVEYLVYEKKQELKKCLPHCPERRAGERHAVEGDTNKELDIISNEVNKNSSSSLSSLKNSLSRPASKKPKTECSAGSQETDHFLKRLKENKPDFLCKNLDAWKKEMDLMIRVDKRSTSKIIEVIDWCTSHIFWKANVLSVATLRKQFDQLEIKMAQDKALTHDHAIISRSCVILEQLKERFPNNCRGMYVQNNFVFNRFKPSKEVSLRLPEQTFVPAILSLFQE